MTNDIEQIKNDQKPGDTFVKHLLRKLNPQPWGTPEKLIIGSIFLFGIANLVMVGLVLIGR